MNIAESAGRGWVVETSHLVGGIDLFSDLDACFASVVDHSRSAPVLMSQAKPSITARVIRGDKRERKSYMNEGGYETFDTSARMTRTIPIRARAELQYAS